MMPEHFALLGVGGGAGVVIHLIASRKTASDRPIWMRLLGVSVAFFIGGVTLLLAVLAVLMVMWGLSV